MKKAGKLDTLETALTTLRLSMGKCAEDVQALRNGFQFIHSRIKYMEYKTIDLEAISRQNNLLFHGISELGRNGECENTEELIRDFLVNMLGVDSEDMVEIQSAYRLGNSRKYDQGRGDFGIRPVLVVFREYRDTEYIIDQARALKGTRYAISRDYPRELNDARKKLLPMMKKARRERKPAQIAYPARLVVNGEITKDEFPGWDDIINSDSIDPDKLPKLSPLHKDHNANSKLDLHSNGFTSVNVKIKSQQFDFANVEPGWTLVVDSHKPMRKWKSCEVLNTAQKDKQNESVSKYSVWKKRGNVAGNRFHCDELF